MRKALVLAAACGVFGMVIGRWTAPMPASADAPMANGDVNADGKLDVSDGIYLINYVFRGGPLPVPLECPPSPLPATGQTVCYSAMWPPQPTDCANADIPPGQDGANRLGCPTEGRFVDNQDGTVTDNCTGLMWQKETEPGTVSWGAALKYCDGLIFAGHGDWRLPNIRELESIVDYGRFDPAIDPVFEAVPLRYWSCSTSASDSRIAWQVDFSYGGFGGSWEYDPNSVRAVRNAQ